MLLHESQGASELLRVITRCYVGQLGIAAGCGCLRSSPLRSCAASASSWREVRMAAQLRVQHAR
jgi:hypothetical protein